MNKTLLSLLAVLGICFTTSANAQQMSEQDARQVVSFMSGFLGNVIGLDESAAGNTPQDKALAEEKAVSFLMSGMMPDSKGNPVFGINQNGYAIYYPKTNRIFAQISPNAQGQILDGNGNTQIVYNNKATSWEEVFKIGNTQFFCAYVMHPSSMLYPLLYGGMDEEEQRDNKKATESFRQFYAQKCSSTCLNAILKQDPMGQMPLFAMTGFAMGQSADNAFALFNHYVQTGRCQ